LWDSVYITNKFINKQEQSLYRFKYLNKKIRWLKTKDIIDKNKNIKPVNYVGSIIKQNDTFTKFYRRHKRG